jgi:hypothetical protein
LRSSDLRQVFLQVDEENDINRVTEYFRWWLHSAIWLLTSTSTYILIYYYYIYVRMYCIYNIYSIYI